MGESMVERPTIESKMAESVRSAASLQVSVSFGRFESDSLSWEKWSSFSPNKYLEEVEKCSTPGSVAQKKAYFEAHYKKIAALKNEQSEQEKLMESVPPSTDEPDIKDPVKNTSVADGELGLSGTRESVEEVEPDVAVTNMLNSTTIEEKQHDATAADCQDLLVGEATEELNGNSASAESNDVQTGKEELISNQAELEVSGVEETTLVEEDASQNNSLEIVEQHLKLELEAKKTPVNKTKSLKLDSGKITQKVTPSTKEHSLTRAKKKVESPATNSSTVNKLSQLSTPRLSRSTMMSGSLSSTKKVNGSSSLLPRAKNTPGENRTALPTSLHMSLSLDPPSSGLSFNTTRKSLIMESMGDKDIVRRAFKTFQNSISGLKSSNDEISSRPQQVPYKGPEKKVSTTLTPRKEKEGLRKSAEKVIQRGRSGNSSYPVKSGSVKGPGADKKSVSVVSSSNSVRNDAKAEKWKEKPGEKSFLREAERSHLSSKTKEDDAQLKNLREGLKSKTILTPAFHRGKVNTKIQSEKDEKNKNPHRLMAKR